MGNRGPSFQPAESPCGLAGGSFRIREEAFIPVILGVRGPLQALSFHFLFLNFETVAAFFAFRTSPDVLILTVMSARRHRHWDASA